MPFERKLGTVRADRVLGDFVRSDVPHQSPEVFVAEADREQARDTHGAQQHRIGKDDLRVVAEPLRRIGDDRLGGKSFPHDQWEPETPTEERQFLLVLKGEGLGNCCRTEKRHLFGIEVDHEASIGDALFEHASNMLATRSSQANGVLFRTDRMEE